MEHNLNICFEAMNQFYYISNEILTYNQLYDKIFKKYLDNESLKDYVHLEYSVFKSKVCELLGIYCGDLVHHFTSLLKSEFEMITYVGSGKLEYVTQSGTNLIFFNANALYLLMDEIIVSNHRKDPEFNFLFMSENELITNIQNNFTPKLYIALSHSLEKLLKFEEIGCWTILLTHIIYSHHDNDPEGNHEWKNIKEWNLEYLNNNKKFYSFSSNNFYQLYKYYNHISNINNKSSAKIRQNEMLEQLISELNPIRVLLFTRCLRRSQEYKKQRYYISNDEVLYIPHLGGNNLEKDGKFDEVLAKTVEVKDLQLYSELLHNICEYTYQNNIIMLNDINIMNKFVEKDLQGQYLSEFCLDHTIDRIKERYNCNLVFPKSFVIPMEKLKSKTHFIDLINSNNLQFPIVIKYKGKSTFYKHLISFIFNLDSYNSFIKYFENEESQNVNCIIQSFINHRGKIFKLYRIKNESYIDMRSSLPDISTLR